MNITVKTPKEIWANSIQKFTEKESSNLMRSSLPWGCEDGLPPHILPS